MENNLREKIKAIKILSKRIAHSTLSGDYASAFKGSGLEFDQIRSYQPGDDIRHIDWNSFAKKDKLMIKQFKEERDRTVILAVDVSRSLSVSSHESLKHDLLLSVCASLTFIAENTKDKIGLLLFSDDVLRWIPPARGKSHTGKIIQTLFDTSLQKGTTNLATALRFLIQLKKRNAVVFMVSDWIDEKKSYTKLLPIAGREYDFVAIRCIDAIENNIPVVGLLELYDPETDETITIDTRKKETKDFLQKRFEEQRTLLKKNAIDVVDIMTHESCIQALISFFHTRTRRQI